MKINVYFIFVVLLCRKDANGFFAFPVTENIAPGYYSIITRPMDFSTMKAKIHNGDYHSVTEYKVKCVELCYFAIHSLTGLAHLTVCIITIDARILLNQSLFRLYVV